MADLHWTMPIARWTSISTAGVPGVEFIDPMVRRRLSRLSRLALQSAHDCTGEHRALRVVFASRHGELARTTGILESIQAADPVSPTAFSLSVLNAVTGVFGIARGDRSAASAIAAGPETLGYALLEAFAQYESDASLPVLLVYAHEPADPVYGDVDDDPESEALAILLDRRSALGHLTCDVTARADSAGEEGTDATQSAAVRRCLSGQSGQSGQAGHADATWQHGDSVWRWSWHAHAA
ncbi:3-oxoacyl-ACP synthase [Burkholderia ubonensis]|uniref:beta-ketoacyl synthase chain length factor n=1 Tax=Burkholderia ubonensis TaxID=101571 RepID=UPI0007568B40|nr:beta-ketoacyl synthase chain length factor [Burkholderia ubonensis]KVO69641.1 3-oxoacyl-ACP synthase [Burkholderia ubonensis]KVP86369.1 3-oxoacyl-ACP synthase [Burkholderia ubonensis]OJB36483.1 3-oxoacyl-ACP synthase [Burkholderia ubonensis]